MHLATRVSLEGNTNRTAYSEHWSERRGVLTPDILKN